VTHLELTPQRSLIHRFNDDAHITLATPDAIP
jgi:hypothetical protein